MERKFLLFGGNGFVGHHLANMISEKKESMPFIFDIEEDLINNFPFENIDVRKKIRTSYSPKKEDVVFNLAAVHRTPGHLSNEYFETNLLGAENICNYARENKINTIVFTSSIATYGTYEKQKSEKTIPMPDIPYGISKLTAEYIHKLWQEEDPKNRKLIIVRPGVVFGEFEKGNFTRLINSIAKNRFFYPGRKDTIKACIYVKDLVDVMLQMIENEKAGVKTYNMTYEPAPKIEQICEVISRQGNLLVPKIKLPSFVLLSISKVIYSIIKREGIHPDRVRKLMISNNINGEKLSDKYNLEYGLEKGISDWMQNTDFKRKKKIH
ncbi:MAG: SDR family oxidoreductase [Algibacter sp.]